VLLNILETTSKNTNRLFLKSCENIKPQHQNSIFSIFIFVYYKTIPNQTPMLVESFILNLDI